MSITPSKNIQSRNDIHTRKVRNHVFPWRGWVRRVFGNLPREDNSDTIVTNSCYLHHSQPLEQQYWVNESPPTPIREGSGGWFLLLKIHPLVRGTSVITATIYWANLQGQTSLTKFSFEFFKNYTQYSTLLTDWSPRYYLWRTKPWTTHYEFSSAAYSCRSSTLR